MTEEDFSSAPLQEIITYRLSRLNARLNAHASRLLKLKAGLTLSQWRVLVMLDTFEKITHADYVKHTRFDKGQASRTISAMVNLGYVKSEPDEVDHRSHTIEMTEKGRKTYDLAFPHMRLRQTLLLEGFSEDERQSLFNHLDRLEAAADTMEAEQ